LHSLRAILFDLGDTVIQYGQVDRAMLFECAVQRTYRLWAQKHRRMPGYRRYYLHQWFAMRWGYLKQLVLRREMNAERYIRRACRKLWLDGSGAFFEELLCAWYSPLEEVATLEAGTREILQTLSDGGYKLAIISNTFVPGHALDRHLERLDLLRFFPHRIYSCDVGYRKPDPRIFQIALRALEVQPAEAVFIGDDLNADIYGAQRAGMLPIWKRSAQAKALGVTGGDVPTIDALDELPALIARLEEWSRATRKIG
jgi:HAD superfamily hydrolase (TIGR01662 family)